MHCQLLLCLFSRLLAHSQMFSNHQCSNHIQLALNHDQPELLIAAAIACDIFSMIEAIEFEEKFFNIVDCFVWMRLFKSNEK